MFAQNHSKVALVIGNASYEKSPLKNPINDANDVCGKLSSLGFEVISAKDCKTKRDMRKILDEFCTEASGAESGVFYYSGHGMQLTNDGGNYLIPINAEMTSEADVPEECISLNYILNKMNESGINMKVAIIDACRDNPFRTWHRGGSKGLSTPGVVPSGTFIAFATSANDVAADGKDRNSPFTNAFLSALDGDNLEIDNVFKEVKRIVREKTNGGQRPWTSNDLSEHFYFAKKEPAMENKMEFITCPTCNGTGIINNTTCSDCKGEGYFTSEFILALKDAWEMERLGYDLSLFKINNETSSSDTIAKFKINNETSSSDSIAKGNHSGWLLGAFARLAAGKYSEDLANRIRRIITSRNQKFTVKGITFDMILVEGGTFNMGATSEQGIDAYDYSKPVHTVSLSNFYIGETEVTQALWEVVMGYNPSHNKGAENPVECVSWNECQLFLNKLNTITGLYFRLPTEAEWEYACRGGSKSKGYKYSGSNDANRVAWSQENSHNSSHQVKTKSPNELGLYDMSGNVWEWCSDWYGDYSVLPQTNPTGPASGSGRTSRSGSWAHDNGHCISSVRGVDVPDGKGTDVGFRIALSTN